MKKKMIFCVGIMFIIAFAVMINFRGSNSSTALQLRDVEALSYGEGPGGPDNRHDQAVNCPTPWNPWNIVPGCCWGYETCKFSVCSNQSGC